MRSNKRETGQAIVLIVVSLVGLIAMAALIIDGGHAYLNRRRAQTAADAAVLAAAHAKCVLTTADADLQTIVDEYAITNNGADLATYTVEYPTDYPKGKLTVETTINATTFFAKVFNQPTVTVKAKAAAGCFLPASANNLIPVAWTCRQQVGGSTDECFIKKIPHSDWDDLVATLGQDWFAPDPRLIVGDPPHILDEGTLYNIPSYTDGSGGPVLYLVMDDRSFDHTNCEEEGLGGIINCDFDDDGVYDVEGGADRGWLYLDGTGGSSLSGLMENGYPYVLELPQWFPGKSGVDAAVFDSAESIKFRISLLPVFNALCEDTYTNDVDDDCPTEFEDGDLVAFSGSSGSQPFYRVPGVAAFVITCVSKVRQDYCPGKDLANLDHNVSTIEGYFIEGFNIGAEIGTGGFDLGVYVLSLTE